MAVSVNGDLDVKTFKALFKHEVQDDGTLYPDLQTAHSARPYRGIGHRRLVFNPSSPYGFDTYQYTGVSASENENIQKLKLVNTNYSPLRTAGAIGDGITDDSAKVNEVIAKGSTITDVGDFNAPGLSNPYGVKLNGPRMLNPKPQGKELLNNDVDDKRIVIGEEQILPFVEKMEVGININILLRADSSLAQPYLPEQYRIAYLLQKMFDNAGISATVINAGVSGLTMEQWRSKNLGGGATYLANDISAAPDLLYLELGINDPAYSNADVNNQMPNNLGQEAPNRRTYKDVTNSLRSSLTTFRNARTAAQTSIIVATPNYTYNLNEGQDARYFSKLRDPYVKVAREMQAMFYDNGAERLEVTKSVAAGWGEDTFNDGVRTLHFLRSHSIHKASKIFEYIVPYKFRQVVKQPTPPPSGTYTYKAVDGTPQWVADSGTPAPAVENLPFTTNRSTYDSDTNEYTAGNNSTNGGDYQNKELSSKKLNSQANGRIQAFFNGTINADVILGYTNTAAVPATFGGVKVGFFLSADGTIWQGTNGNFATINVAIVANSYYGIVAATRNGTASFKLFRSATVDFASPTLVYTYDAAIVGSYTGNLYPVFMAENSKKLTNPKFLGLINY